MLEEMGDGVLELGLGLVVVGGGAAPWDPRHSSPAARARRGRTGAGGRRGRGCGPAGGSRTTSA